MDKTPTASNSAFISYRRNISGYPARAVFQDLRSHGIDAFMDIESIDSGQFETVILNQIAARPYFLIILGPGCLDRCADPGDWLRLEIEHAMSLDRIIVPLLTSNFDFNASYAKPYLTGKIAKLSTFNAVNVPLDYFDEALERLRKRFLKPVNLQTTPTPTDEQSTVQRKIEQVDAEPVVTDSQLNAQGYFERALARLDNDLAGKIDDYTEALRLDPQNAEAFNNRGLARNSKGDLEGAIADFTVAIRLQPDIAAFYNNRAVVFKDNGNLDAALADLDQATRLYPYYSEALYNRGFVHYAKDQLDTAIADFSQVIQLDPTYINAYVIRGMAFSEIDQPAQAVADFRHVLEVQPDHRDAALMSAYIFDHDQVGQ